MSDVHFILPEGIDDPARPSGGNMYDRRVCEELAARGRPLHVHAVAGEAALERAVRRIPDGAVVMLDGLIASPAPDVLVPHAGRLRLVTLMHMPLGDEAERAVLEAAAGVIATSAWTRGRLQQLYGLPVERIHVAEPGVDAAPVARGTAGGGELLCVAAVTPSKGHDLLLDGLATAEDLPWHCTCVGILDRDPAFADGVRGRAQAALRDRVRFTGPLAGPDLDRAYAAADLLVLASRAETYGLVVTEALARGVPVLACDVGGVGEALRGGGLLVPAGDFASALRAWLTDGGLRARLRRAALERRAALRPWAATAADVAGALAKAAVLEAVR